MIKPSSHNTREVTCKRIPGIHYSLGKESNNRLIAYADDCDHINRSHKTQTKWIHNSPSPQRDLKLPMAVVLPPSGEEHELGIKLSLKEKMVFIDCN